MSKITRYVIAIVMLMASSLLLSAQVELHTELVAAKQHEIYGFGTAKDKTVVNYLLLTAQEEHCASTRTEYSSYPVLVCIFEDPTTGNLLHYTGLNRGNGVKVSFGHIAFLTFYDGDIVYATDNDDTILTNLALGDWKVDVYYNGVQHSSVAFNIESMEFHTVGSEPLEEQDSYKDGSRDDKTIVDFLLVTAQDEHCAIADIYHNEDRRYDPAIVCVFENPLTGDSIFHAGIDRGEGVTGSGSGVMHLIYHEGELVHVTADKPILTDLAPGEWKVDVYRNGEIKAFVTFDIESDDE